MVHTPPAGVVDPPLLPGAPPALVPSGPALLVPLEAVLAVLRAGSTSRYLQDGQREGQEGR